MNIGLIGVGKLGLAYALVFEQYGFNVVASSYKKDYVDELQLKITDTTEPGIKELLEKSRNIEFTLDNHRVINTCDFIYVMVATPSTELGDYDISAVEMVAQDLLNHPGQVDGKILIVGSTVNPGTCVRLQELVKPRGIHVVYCPTFVAQGTVLKNIQNPHTLSIGTENLTIAKQCQKIFSKICSSDTSIYIMQSTTAEILKLAGNCKATLDISYFNMIGQILINAGLQQDLKIASTYLNFVKQSSNWSFGFGYGGPCYPRDNRAFVYYAQQNNTNYPLGILVDQFNISHIDFLTGYLLTNNSKNLPFYFDYVSYKKGVNIFEESHQLQVCKNLLRKGCKVYIEPTIYLLPVIIEELQKEFTTIEFVSFNDLTARGIEVYLATDF